jgi:hypothetical protein
VWSEAGLLLLSRKMAGDALYGKGVTALCNSHSFQGNIKGQGWGQDSIRGKGWAGGGLGVGVRVGVGMRG